MRFHVSLPVTDIDETAAFYRILFDTEPAKTFADYVKFLPRAGGLNITFHRNAKAVGRARELHLGFELSDEAALDSVHERLDRAGLVSRARETSVCCYANQDKFWVTDPDGYEWELYLVVNDSDRRNSAAPARICC